MLQDVFYWIFNMSIITSLTGFVVLLVRLFKRIPRRVVVYLWLIPFLRMIVPFGLNSPYSLMSLLSRAAARTIVVYQSNHNLVLSMMNCVTAADTYFPTVYKSRFLDHLFCVASVIWIIVTVLMLLFLAVLYVSMHVEVRRSTHLRDHIYLSDKFTSPAVYGIFKPWIILPESYKDRNIELVQLHEQTHIESFDNLWRLLALVICVVHWFNPFSWLFLRFFLMDLELSCDERVLLKLGSCRAKEYALCLLDCRQATGVFTSSFGGAKIRLRIENILSFKKLTWLSGASFAILLGCIFYTLLTNAG